MRISRACGSGDSEVGGNVDGELRGCVVGGGEGAGWGGQGVGGAKEGGFERRK